MLTSFVASLYRIPVRGRTAICGTATVLLLALFAPVASAQATYTADRVDGFSVFGGYSFLNTDYGVKDQGYMAGADYTHSIGNRYLVPSIEARYMGSTGPAITEDSFLGGLKVETHFRRLHPYAGAFVGYGVINYVQVHQNDNSIAYAIAVGADYYVTHSLAVKVDAQEQFWKLGQASNELTPQTLSIGVLYRLPSSFRRK